MNTLFHLLLVHLVTSVVDVRCDIGEKIRLGLPITPPESAGNQEAIGLETPIKSSSSSTKNVATTGRKKIIVAVPHNHAEEFNLEKLCNDPFHSFLCQPTAPRKRRIDGNLRPGASLPDGFTKSNSGIVSGSSVLPANLEPANSDENVAKLGYSYQKPEEPFVSPEQSVQNNVFTEGFRPDAQSKTPVEKPSNEYLPSFESPKPQGSYNFPFSLPLEASTSPSPTRLVTTATSSTTVRPSTTQRFTLPSSSTTPPLFGFQNNQVFNTNLNATVTPTTPVYQYTRPSLQPQFGFGYQYNKPPSVIDSPSASNQVLSSISNSNEYLPPKDSLSPGPSDNVQFQVPFTEDDDVKSAPQNAVPTRLGSGVLSTGNDPTPKPAKKERTHTLEELCKDSFHSFLCKPIDKPRRRIDGNIRPGAKIPAHVLVSAGSNSQSVKQLPPNQSGGAVLDESLDGYKYEKPAGQPFQTTNLSPQYAPRPSVNSAKPLYTYQQAILNSSPSNAQPSVVAAKSQQTYSNSPVPCTCHQAAATGNPEPAAQNLAPTALTGYTYTRPSTAFTLPATSTTRPTGYTYPKPAGQPFTLPSRTVTTTSEPSSPSGQRGKQSVPASVENNALPPSSQFEILTI